MILKHEDFRQFAADNNLKMQMDFRMPGMCQVTLHGFDDGRRVEGQGNTLQAAIYSVAEKISGEVCLVGGVEVTAPRVIVKEEK